MSPSQADMILIQQTSKIGLAFSLELAGEELMEQAERAEPSDAPPIPF
jgi:hypothetical protein